MLQDCGDFFHPRLQLLQRKLMSRDAKAETFNTVCQQHFHRATAQVKLQTWHFYWISKVTCAAAIATSSALEVLSSPRVDTHDFVIQNMCSGRQVEIDGDGAIGGKLTSLQGGNAAK